MLEEKELSQVDYRKIEALSSSDIRTLLTNPYLFSIKYEKQATETMKLGSAIHSLLIEPDNFNRDFLVMPELNLRTKEGRETKAKLELENKDKTILSNDLYIQATNCANVIKESEFNNFFKNGYGERSYFGEIDGVKCKCRPDYIVNDRGRAFIVDLKTTGFGGANPNEFSRKVANMGYYIQAAFYLELIEDIKNFFFLVIETEPPYMIGLYDLDNVSLDYGREQIKKAINVYKNIDNIKNVYVDKISNETLQTLTLPNYVFYN